MKVLRLLSVAFAICYLIASVSLADEGKDESGKGKKRLETQDKRGGKGSYFHERGYTCLDIPKGHYPPPGECRIWYPGRPAGQQPPPGECSRLRAEIPSGSPMLISSETAWKTQLLNFDRARSHHSCVICWWAATIRSRLGYAAR